MSTRPTVFNVISTDGFSISFDKQYKTMGEAQTALDSWVTTYERQGYYSSVNYGRIPLNEVKGYCEIHEEYEDEEEDERNDEVNESTWI